MVRPRRQEESFQNAILKSWHHHHNHELTVSMVTCRRMALATIIHGRENLALPNNLIVIDSVREGVVVFSYVLTRLSRIAPTLCWHRWPSLNSVVHEIKQININMGK